MPNDLNLSFAFESDWSSPLGCSLNLHTQTKSVTTTSLIIIGIYISLPSIENITWMDKMTNEELYGNLPRISNKIRERRLGLAGHCVRYSELEVSNLVLWDGSQRKSNRGSQSQYVTSY